MGVKLNIIDLIDSNIPKLIPDTLLPDEITPAFIYVDIDQKLKDVDLFDILNLKADENGVIKFTIEYNIFDFLRNHDITLLNPIVSDSTSDYTKYDILDGNNKINKLGLDILGRIALDDWRNSLIYIKQNKDLIYDNSNENKKKLLDLINNFFKVEKNIINENGNDIKKAEHIILLLKQVKEILQILKKYPVKVIAYQNTMFRIKCKTYCEFDGIKNTFYYEGKKDSIGIFKNCNVSGSVLNSVSLLKIIDSRIYLINDLDSYKSDTIIIKNCTPLYGGNKITLKISKSNFVVLDTDITNIKFATPIKHKYKLLSDYHIEDSSNIDENFSKDNNIESVICLRNISDIINLQYPNLIKDNNYNVDSEILNKLIYCLIK